MRLLCLAATLPLIGCGDDVVFGDLQIVSSGGDRVLADACFDAQLIGCNDPMIELVVSHAGARAPMPYEGFLFPRNQAVIDLIDRAEPFVIAGGGGEARIDLPPPFELEGVPESPLSVDETIELSWEGAGEPMRWGFSYDCESSSGAIAGDIIDDSGTLEISMARIAADIDDFVGATPPCAIEIRVSRVRVGTIDDLDFDLATGIERRSFDVELQQRRLADRDQALAAR